MLQPKIAAAFFPQPQEAISHKPHNSMPRTTPPLSISASQALYQLGTDITDARKRRRISTTVMADQLQVSRPTLRRLENGDPGVSMGAYVAALDSFGMVERIAFLASVSYDKLGQQLAHESLPQRIFRP